MPFSFSMPVECTGKHRKFWVQDLECSKKTFLQLKKKLTTWSASQSTYYALSFGTSISSPSFVNNLGI